MATSTVQACTQPSQSSPSPSRTNHMQKPQKARDRRCPRCLACCYHHRTTAGLALAKFDRCCATSDPVPSYSCSSQSVPSLLRCCPHSPCSHAPSASAVADVWAPALAPRVGGRARAFLGVGLFSSRCSQPTPTAKVDHSLRVLSD